VACAWVIRAFLLIVLAGAAAIPTARAAEKTESDWLVSAIATDISEMAALALNRPVPSVEVHREDPHCRSINYDPELSR